MKTKLLVVFALSFACFVGALALMAFTKARQSSLPTFLVRDPKSPTVVRVNGTMALLGPTQWGCIISADGERSTQHTGWPQDRIAADAEPKAVTWHSDPDWVEILLSSGERLKLTWDQAAVQQARASQETHHYLAPKFEVLKDQP